MASQLRFWNGNKSAVRQKYELALLTELLKITNSVYSNMELIEDKTDYPNSEDESRIFEKHIDICVTVAGNPKFKADTFIPVYRPLMRGFLGHRLLIIRCSDADEFASITNIKELKQKIIGVPATWADATLYRQNEFSVYEHGAIEDTIRALQRGQCDYIALGVNEIEDMFATHADDKSDLFIEQHLRLYYPFALVFYVHPEQPKLAAELKSGLQSMTRSPAEDQLFRQTFASIISKQNLLARQQICLNNPLLPNELHDVMVTEKKQFEELINQF